MKQIIQKISAFPYYVFGIILFFLTHGYSENEGLIPFYEMLGFFFIAASVALVPLLIFKKKMGSFIKAGIITGAIVFFYLFYGSLQDGLKDSVLLHQLSRYRLLLSAITIILFFLYFFIKRSLQNFKKLTLCSNTIVLVLIIIDLMSISGYFLKGRSKDEIQKDILESSLLHCDSCAKPDIYLIVLDEYWGNNSLKKYFNYNNSNLNKFLKEEGFFVASKPFSNYSITPLSMASILNMGYMQWMIGRKAVNAKDYAIAVKEIRYNVAVRFLLSEGYSIKNCSLFILEQPAGFDFDILPIKIKLILQKNLFNRIERDWFWTREIGIGPKFHWVANNSENKFIEDNDGLIDLTYEAIKSNDTPKFVYTHLMLPHFPYLYDSLGTKKDFFFFDYLNQEAKDNDYLQYLVYANGTVENIIKSVMNASHGNAVIVLMSDHGYRSFDPMRKDISANNNLNAVYLPKQDYHLFYDSISNVNQFRVLFNTLFSQHLPMIEDSCGF